MSISSGWFWTQTFLLTDRHRSRGPMAEPEWLGSLFFGLIILSFIPGPWQAPVFNGGSAWGGKQLDVWTPKLLKSFGNSNYSPLT